jgi:enoyl-CoA hydratase/carnithine racemase
MWEITDHNRVRILAIDRPEALNAINGEVSSGLIRALSAAAMDDQVRAVILTGKGEAFSAGADLDLLESAGQADNANTLRETIPAMFEALIDFPKPLLMAVNGLGIGFGATVLGLADMVVMAEDARIMVPFSTLAVVPEACSSYTLPLRMGHQQAFWFLLSGEWMNAKQCQQAGLALDVVPGEEVIETTLNYAHKLAAFPTHTLVESKALMRLHHREQLLLTNRAEIERLIALLEHPACKEGIAAIREKREPDYSAF